VEQQLRRCSLVLRKGTVLFEGKNGESNGKRVIKVTLTLIKTTFPRQESVRWAAMLFGNGPLRGKSLHTGNFLNAEGLRS